MSKSKHPMQRVYLDAAGTPRFRENNLVRVLVDTYGLNDLTVLFPSSTEHAEDWMQLAQLIGYSVAGYGDLSYVNDESYDKAYDRATKLLEKARKGR